MICLNRKNKTKSLLLHIKQARHAVDSLVYIHRFIMVDRTRTVTSLSNNANNAILQKYQNYKMSKILVSTCSKYSFFKFSIEANLSQNGFDFWVYNMNQQ